ncbi:MAG: alkane 1-monooxygenase [Myxococcota bacterium]
MHPMLYLFALLPGLVTLAGLGLGGLWSWGAVALIFGICPVLDGVVGGGGPRQRARQTSGPAWVANAILALTLPLCLSAVAMLWWRASVGQFTLIEWIGAILSVGICLGVYGLNVGHELGHRGGRWGKWSAFLLMGSSLYAHFWVEHNLGHHVNVATPEDPASAERGEWVYGFWARSVVGGARSALALAPRWVGAAWLVQLLVLGGVAIGIGWAAALAWVAAAVVGVLLLETVNYVEHYGLRRRRLADGRYERVSPMHSWNSEHRVGRALLFDLPRHADHHAHPRRSCHELRYFAQSRQLPAGYPTMILTALAPPVFHMWMDSALKAENAVPER